MIRILIRTIINQIVSHATAPTQRPPVVIPELGGALPKPALGELEAVDDVDFSGSFVSDSFRFRRLVRILMKEDCEDCDQTKMGIFQAAP